MSLTDAQWARIEPLLPVRTPRRGGRRRDRRQVIDAARWVWIRRRDGRTGPLPRAAFRPMGEWK
ncbi:transposase [Streptomyces sp. NPDC004126]|uniref:transposase n=1 Tax=Streptomyces sp. NPDC004126 TaxID=3390695 RepID=UPI003D04E025